MPTNNAAVEAAGPTSPSSDHRPTTPLRWPLHAVVWVLLPLAIAGSAVLSGAATLALAARHNVPVEVRPALLGMVEVVSLAGTLGAIFAARARLRARSMLAVVAASAVALVAGWQAYGWVGALASPFLVGLVHLAAEAWQELRTRPVSVIPEKTDTGPADVSVNEHVEPDLELVVDQPDQCRPADPTGPVLGPPTLVEHLRARPALPSERDLVAEQGVTRHRAKALLREARTGLREVSA